MQSDRQLCPAIRQPVTLYLNSLNAERRLVGRWTSIDPECLVGDRNSASHVIHDHERGVFYFVKVA